MMQNVRIYQLLIIEVHGAGIVWLAVLIPFPAARLFIKYKECTPDNL
jgi:hypothetical protein